jgi:hypothetical protein
VTNDESNSGIYDLRYTIYESSVDEEWAGWLAYPAIFAASSIRAPDFEL